MNSIKLMLRFTGVIAAVAIAASPMAAFAQSQQSQQAEPPIVLNQEQQAKLEQLQVRAIADIEAVLNDKQKAQFARGRETGTGFREVEELTDPQRTQILKILENFNTKISELLTTEQKEKIREFQRRNQQNQPNQNRTPQNQPKR